MNRMLVHEAEITSIDEENHTVRVRFTDELEDRDGEIMDQDTFDTSHWIQAPSVLFGHDQKSLENIIGKGLEVYPTTYMKDGKQVKAHEAVVQFDIDDDYSKRAWGKVVRGYLKTVSVGFTKARKQGNRIMNALMTELTFTPVPSNIGATVKSFNDGTMSIDDAQWLRDQAQKTVESLTKFLDGSQSGEDTTMTDEELGKIKTMMTEVVDAKIAPLQQEIAGLTEKVGKFGEKPNEQSGSDANDPSKNGSSTNESEMSQEEADAVLEQFKEKLEERKAQASKDSEEEKKDGD